MSTLEKSYPSDVNKTALPADIGLGLHVSNVGNALVAIGKKSTLRRLS
jgi:hypothetical protein